jgi:hypothetical protein
VVRAYEHRYKPSLLIGAGECYGQLSDCDILKNESVARCRRAEIGRLLPMQDFKSFIYTILIEIATSLSCSSFAPEERAKMVLSVSSFYI